MSKSKSKNSCGELLYYWFSWKQMNRMTDRFSGDERSNTIVISGKRTAFTECTTKAEPAGNWNDYVFVGMAFGMPGLIVDDTNWAKYAPPKSTYKSSALSTKEKEFASYKKRMYDAITGAFDAIEKNKETKMKVTKTQITKALIESIAHWENLKDGNEHDHKWTACPLCKLFLDKDPDTKSCDGCPIAEHTGKSYCVDSPWILYHGSPTDINAQKEIDFLKDVRDDYLEKAIREEILAAKLPDIDDMDKEEQGPTDITPEIVWGIHTFNIPGSDDMDYWVMGSHEENIDFIYLNGADIFFNNIKYEDEYEIIQTNLAFRVVKKHV